jgi:hypothetical protein
VGTPAQEHIDQAGAGVEEVLAVVEHQEQVSGAQGRQECRQQGLARLLAHSDGRRHGRDDHGRIDQGRQLDQPDRLGKGPNDGTGDVQRQTSLATATGARKRHEAMVSEQVDDVRRLLAATHEAGELGRQVVAGPLEARPRSSPVVGQLNFGFGSQLAAIDLRLSLSDRQLRWFDHWLKGIDTGIMAEPPIKLFVMGANVWRDEEEWPLARAVDTRYYLRAGGHLSQEPPGAEEPDHYAYDPANPVPTLGGAILLAPEYAAGPYDQRPIEARPDVVVFSTSPLVDDTEVTGPIEVRLWATSSAPDTDFVARLVDVYPDGRSINLTDGIIRARYRNFHLGEPPSLIEPGRPYEYAIDLWATSNVFRAGHRSGCR